MEECCAISPGRSCTPALDTSDCRRSRPCLLFAVDSIINDLCLAILVLTDVEGDAATARDASALRVGVAVSLDDSPGLELSDGAMFS